MTLAEITRSRTRRRTSAIDAVLADLDWMKILRLGVFVVYLVLLLLLA